MQKVLNNYENNPTIENARKVCAYDRKYLMASCFLNPEQLAVRRQAIEQAGA